MTLSRGLQRAAHRLADQQSERLRFLGKSQVIATVTGVTAGGAEDGIAALVTVTWRGEPVVASGYNAAYTPVVNDRVKCSIVDDQLCVDYRIVGSP